VPPSIKVLIVMGPIAQGGAEWQIYHLLRLLDKDRFQPLLASVRFADSSLVIDDGDRLIRDEFYSLGVPIYEISEYRRNDPSNALALARIIRDLSVDVVHANLYPGETWGRLAAFLTGVPVIIHKRGMPFLTGKSTHVLVDWLLNLRTTRIIVPSNAVRDRLIGLEPLLKDKVNVIYSGVDLNSWKRASSDELISLRRELGISEGEFVITNVARLRKIKGQEYLIRAAPKVIEQYPNTRFLFVGNGELQQYLSDLANSLGIGSRVLFLGARKDIDRILSLTDVFVFPSLQESFGVALVEAALMGVPAVATRVGGITEIVIEGETGLLVPPCDPEALASSVIRLLSEDSLREHMGLKAKECAASRFDIKLTVGKLQEEYLKAAGVRC